MSPTDQPSDNTTLTEIIDEYQAAGYATDFWPEADGTVRCAQCQSLHPAAELSMLSMRRMEGASDPADMLMVVATACPVCGAEGTMVLGYGPAASDVDAAVGVALDDRRP